MFDLDLFFPDTIQILTAGGGVQKNVRAQFTKQGKVLLCDDKLPVKEGDGVRRTLPNGNVEDYSIEYVHFQRSHGDIPSIVELTVHKIGIPRRAQAPPAQNVYNLSGPHSRVNINSTDNSVNVTHSETSLFAAVRQAVDQVDDRDLREKLHFLVGQMEETQKTPSFAHHFKEFAALAANVITVVGPFLPRLAQLLG